MSSSGARESRWLELATLRALMASARDAAAVPAVAAGRELLRRQQQQPGRRGGGGDHAAAAGGNDKRAKVIAGFFAAAIVGSFCNFLTVIYIGFVSAHTLPVLYEKYQDQVDDFLYNMLGLLQNQYQNLSKGALSKGKLRKSD